ncbi:hypothetical protein EMCRGX_G020794 [Ephydatia muelleri]
MDIVGPLPRSRAGNKYILVLCDYATRYPEAVPPKSIDAESVAEELIKKLLQMHPIRTSPYHPQTDGLVERSNQTLKSMLRKSGTDGGKEWDKKIPYLLFAYREVPQASTGFSPFELLYGRDVNYLIDMQDKRKRKRVFHVNVLKDFHIREAGQGCLAEEVQEGEDEIDIPPWRGDNSGKKFDLTMGEELVSNQKVELKELLEGRDSVKKELAEMERNGIIEPACSEWASPLIVAMKKSGELRLCVDYRKLNAVTKFDTYLMPRIEELINRVGRAKFITTLDLTGLLADPGIYKGSAANSGAPATFQRLMDRLLRGCEDFAVAIFSDEWKDHINHLQEVLIRLESAGLTVKLSKSKFAMQSVEYFRHKIEACMQSVPFQHQIRRLQLRLSGSPLDGPDKKNRPEYCALECFVTGGILKDNGELAWKEDEGRMRYILTLSDYFSKWVKPVATISKVAHQIASALYKIFMRMGLPCVLTTDNGSEFKNKLNAEMMKLLGIKQCNQTPNIHSPMVLTKDLIKPCRGCLSKQLQDRKRTV